LLEDRCDRSVPAGEAPYQLRFPSLGFVELALRSILGRKPVRASVPDIDEAEALTDAPRLRQAPGVHGYGRDAAPHRVSGVADPHIGDRSTADRMQSVGAHEQIAAMLAAVGTVGDDAVLAGLDSGDIDAQ